MYGLDTEWVGDDDVALVQLALPALPAQVALEASNSTATFDPERPACILLIRLVTRLGRMACADSSDLADGNADSTEVIEPLGASQVQRGTGLPRSLMTFLASDRCVGVGVGVRLDLKLLLRQCLRRPSSESSDELRACGPGGADPSSGWQCLELAQLALQCGVSGPGIARGQSLGLRALSCLCLGRDLRKDK